MRRLLTLLWLSLAICLVATNSLWGQANDRAVVTGFVTDTSGAAVPGAKVTVTNQDTGVHVDVATDSSGAFGTPTLILGNYSVQVEKEGFQTFLKKDIVLTGGMTSRQDVQLQVGAQKQTIEVTAQATMINSQSAEVSHSLGQRYYEDLPAVMGADIRLAESLLQVQPGYIPMAPNGDAIFRGSQFQSRINGGQTMSTENWFDGAAFGYAEGHQQTQESSLPYESVKEMRVIENQFSAQYGHTSGGIIEYTTKSGTNEYHGDVYDYLSSGKVNSRNFFLYDKPGQPGTAILPLTQNNYGFTLGGPVRIPHVYNGKGKTFFFATWDALDYKSTVNTGFVNTLPLQAQKNGDFSALLDTNNQVGTDALGRPIFAGQIFNPATTRLVNGVPVRDPYQGNIIPPGDPLRSAIAAKIVPLIPAPDQQTLTVNGYGGTSDDNNKINVRTWLVRVDHTFNDRFSLSNTWYTNNRPRTAHCGGPGGCNTVNDGQLESAKNDTYFGQGFYQLITNHYDHLQLSWVMKPNLFNHTTMSYDRWVMGGHSIAGGVGWPQKLGLTGIIDQNAGPPGIGFGGGLNYTALGNSWTNGWEVNNRYQFLDDLTYIRGKHTIKTGWEYRYMQFPQHGWAVQTGGNYNFSTNETAGYNATGTNLSQTGDAFASFLLGQVDNAYFNIPLYYTPIQKYTAMFVQDDIKVTSKLTVNLGMRWDYQSGMSEQHNRFSWLDPGTPDPVAPGVSIPGGFLFATSSRPVYEVSHWNWGPRFGFAYAISDKSVIRGGYGIFYAGVNADQWTGKPVTGFQTTPTAPNLTNGYAPAFYWDSGFPEADILKPPNTSPSVANGTGPVTVTKDQNTLPRYQNWSLSYQHQLSNSMLIDIDYVGNHGTRLVMPPDNLGLLFNALDPNVLNTYTPAQLQGPPATLPYPGFTGDLAQALRLYPQYQNIFYRSVPEGNSNYHALQALFEKRMDKRGLQFRASFTWSKLINDGAEAGHGGQSGGQFGGQNIQNPLCRVCERSVSVDDVPRYLALSWIYELPFGQGKYFGSGATGVLGKVIGGWKLSATQTYQEGRPLQIAMNNDLGGLIFNRDKRPDVVTSVPGRNATFKDPFSDFYLNTNAWSDPGKNNVGNPNFGNADRTNPHVRGPHFYNEDFSLMKDTKINESSYVRFEANAGNLFNRIDFCLPQQNWSVAQSMTSTGQAQGFGTTGSQCNIPRRIQFGLSIHF